MMKELQLQPRLQHLANLIPQGAHIADIGTDHGYLPVWLIQHGCCSSAIASDIAPDPLEHARHTAAAYGVGEIDFRLCAGLDGIAPGEVDTVIIAGMGGDSIIAILEAAPWTKNGVKLLIQPMTKVEMLRCWLADNGYDFVAESLIWDKEHLYPVMEITGGTRNKLTAVEEYGGIRLEDDPLYADYLSHQISRLDKAIDGLSRASNDGSRDRACQLGEIRDALEKKRNTL